MEELFESIQTAIIQNTKMYEGINYSRLKKKVFKIVEMEIVERGILFGYPITPALIKTEIDKQILGLIAMGLLESINGYIFNPHKISIGENIPLKITEEAEIYKQVYREYPVTEYYPYGSKENDF